MHFILLQVLHVLKALMLASKIVADFAVVAIHSCSQKDIHLCDNIIMIFVKTKINELFELSAGVQIDRQLVELQILVKHHNLVVLKIIFDNFDFMLTTGTFVYSSGY